MVKKWTRIENLLAFHALEYRWADEKSHMNAVLWNMICWVTTSKGFLRSSPIFVSNMRMRLDYAHAYCEIERVSSFSSFTQDIFNSRGKLKIQEVSLEVFEWNYICSFVLWFNQSSQQLNNNPQYLPRHLSSQEWNLQKLFHHHWGGKSLLNSSDEERRNFF